MIYSTMQGDFIRAKSGKKGLLLAGMMVMPPERLCVTTSKHACTILEWVSIVQVTMYIQ